MNETTTETEQANDALKFAFKITHGYIQNINRRFEPGVKFSERGLARAASVFGWVTGIAQSNNIPLANKLAADFIENLDYLANYGGRIVYTKPGYGGTTVEVRIPAYIVKLCDDGTAHGFAVGWYRPLMTPEIVARHKELGRNIETFDYKEIPHGYSHNGGLIYHGPGCGESFSVSLTPKLWSVHT